MLLVRTFLSEFKTIITFQMLLFPPYTTNYCDNCQVFLTGKKIFLFFNF